MELIDKPFKKWTDKEFEELFEYYRPLVDKAEVAYWKRLKALDTFASDHRLQCLREKERLFKDKRKIFQPFIVRMYNEAFESLGNVTVKITHSEADWIEDWVRTKLLGGSKSFEPGRKADGANMIPRQINGSTGEYGVIKFLGGDRSDFNTEVGNSKNFTEPDLKKFLGGRDVGVKAAKTGASGNLPLINYDPMDRVITAQILVGQRRIYKNDKYKFKYYIIGVVTPEDIIKYSKALFTLDPNAHRPEKRGGPKYGFWKLINAVHFKTKEELIELLDKPEYRPLEI